jgi:transposase-like protein
VKKSRFTDEQTAFALKQAETGTRIDEICRKMGISDATFYKWRRKLPQNENNMKIEASISLRRRNEEVKVYGEPD